MITSNVLLRTFRLQYGDNRGTCFAVDVDGRQYLITAKHLVDGMPAKGVINIYQNGNWSSIAVSLVGFAPGNIDIAVLATDRVLVRDLPLPANMAEIILGQDVYFLGFPYDMFTEVPELKLQFPLPFIKKGTASSFNFRLDRKILYIDGYNNPGFSGGPVVFAKQGQRDFNVVSVISGFRAQKEPIYDGKDMTQLIYYYNTGIVISYGVSHAIDIIKENPIGVQL